MCVMLNIVEPHHNDGKTCTCMNPVVEYSCKTTKCYMLKTSQNRNWWLVFFYL